MNIEREDSLKNFISALIVFNIILFASRLESAELPKDIKVSDIEYIVTLTNGDQVSGKVIEIVNDPEDGEGIKLKTPIGNAIIYASQIKEIIPKSTYYRHDHRVFLLPTSEPIKDNHFIGSFELLFVYFGAGIGDWLSITAGRSVVPGIPSGDQLSEMNMKFSVLDFKTDENQKLGIALGANLAFVNHNNQMMHAYATGTYSFYRTSITLSTFGKISGRDFYDVRLGVSNHVNLTYTTGSVGIGLGIDTRFSQSNNLHFIGEIWNSDVSKPTSSALLLGLRLANSTVSADFGLSFFTQPFVAPFTSFVWTPF